MAASPPCGRPPCDILGPSSNGILVPLGLCRRHRLHDSEFRSLQVPRETAQDHCMGTGFHQRRNRRRSSGCSGPRRLSGLSGRCIGAHLGLVDADGQRSRRYGSSGRAFTQMNCSIQNLKGTSCAKQDVILYEAVEESCPTTPNNVPGVSDGASKTLPVITFLPVVFPPREPLSSEPAAASPGVGSAARSSAACTSTLRQATGCLWLETITTQRVVETNRGLFRLIIVAEGTIVTVINGGKFRV